MKLVIGLFILLLGMAFGQAEAQDGLIIPEPGLEEGRPLEQNQMTVLPLDDVVEIESQDCDTEEQSSDQRVVPRSAPAQPNKQKPKSEPKNDPKVLEWLFKKHKMPSLHFIDLLEMID